jgi:caffeoyl-CoA O-methyltransferase
MMADDKSTSHAAAPMSKTAIKKQAKLEQQKKWKYKREKKKRARGGVSPETIEGGFGASAEDGGGSDRHNPELASGGDEGDVLNNAGTAEGVSKKKSKKNKAMAAHAGYQVLPTTLATDDDGHDRSSPPAHNNTAPNALEMYAITHSSPEPPLLSTLRTVTKETFPSASHMTSGPLQGRLLAQLVRMTGSRNILEIGTFCGYGTLSLAEGLPTEGGNLTSLEIDPDAAAVAITHIKQSTKLSFKIKVIIAPAMETLKALAAKDGDPFDFVFIDADKRSYRAYHDYLLSSNLLTPNATILVDNVLFKGLVLNSRKFHTSTIPNST